MGPPVPPDGSPCVRGSSCPGEGDSPCAPLPLLRIGRTARAAGSAWARAVPGEAATEAAFRSASVMAAGWCGAQPASGSRFS